MKSSTVRGFTLISLFGCLLATVAHAAKPPPTWDGLELRKVKGLDVVYVRPNVEFTPYKTVQLAPVTVEFSKNWEKNSRDYLRRLDTKDLQDIKDRVASLMLEAFTEELTENGYALVDAPTHETLQVRTAIIDLYINAPDSKDPGITRSYTTSAGRMTLVLEARDGPTAQILARVVDARSDDHAGGNLQWTTSASNTADAKRIMKSWAVKLREALDRLNGKEK